MRIRAPRAILRQDDILVYRGSTTTDAEGDPSGSRALVLTTKGTISSASAQEIMSAAERGTSIDQVLSLELPLDVRAGDFVASGGVTFEVVSVDPQRLYKRCVMRTVQ